MPEPLPQSSRVPARSRAAFALCVCAHFQPKPTPLRSRTAALPTWRAFRRSQGKLQTSPTVAKTLWHSLRDTQLLLLLLLLRDASTSHSSVLHRGPAELPQPSVPLLRASSPRHCSGSPPRPARKPPARDVPGSTPGPELSLQSPNGVAAPRRALPLPWPAPGPGPRERCPTPPPRGRRRPALPGAAHRASSRGGSPAFFTRTNRRGVFRVFVCVCVSFPWVILCCISSDCKITFFLPSKSLILPNCGYSSPPAPHSSQAAAAFSPAQAVLNLCYTSVTKRWVLPSFSLSHRGSPSPDKKTANKCQELRLCSASFCNSDGLTVRLSGLPNLNGSVILYPGQTLSSCAFTQMESCLPAPTCQSPQAVRHSRKRQGQNLIFNLII